MRFSSEASRQASRDMEALEDEFADMSDAYLSKEADRIEDLARVATSNAGKLRAEMMRRMLKDKESPNA